MSQVQSWSYSYVNTAEADRAAEAQSNRGGKGGGGWLMALALTLGKIADRMGQQLLGLAKQIDAKNASGDTDGITELNAKMQVQTQLMSMMIQSMNTIIKTLGEGNKDVARKQ